jgi:hypothetical protein
MVDRLSAACGKHACALLKTARFRANRLWNFGGKAAPSLWKAADPLWKT